MKRIRNRALSLLLTLSLAVTFSDVGKLFGV